MAGIMDYLMQGASQDSVDYEAAASLMDDPYMQAQQMTAPMVQPPANEPEVDHNMFAGQPPQTMPSATPKMDNALNQVVATAARPANNDPLIQRLAMNFFAPKTYKQDQARLLAQQESYDANQAANQLQQAYKGLGVQTGSPETNKAVHENMLKIKAEAAKGPTMGAGYKAALGQGLTPGTPEFKAYADKYNFKPSNVIQMPQSQKYIPPTAKVVDKDGNPVKIPMGATMEYGNNMGWSYDPVTDADKKLTVALDQMERSSASLNRTVNFYDPNKLSELASRNIPFLPEDAKNYLRDDIAKEFNSAKKGWQEQVLRDATGAVINQSEYDDYDIIYMPQPFDPPEELERKAKLRHDKENAYRVRLKKPRKKYVSPYGDSKGFNVRSLSKPIKTAYDNMTPEHRKKFQTIPKGKQQKFINWTKTQGVK